MHKKHSDQRNDKNNKTKNSQWIDTLDLELIFMNSIAICIILLAIVAADVLMP
jgi:hypothetical protein